MSIDLTSLRILLAEDNQVNQKLALLQLKKIGYQADVASNGEEVLEKIGDQVYDVILMDMQMPVMDGISATRALRAAVPPHQQPYIIALTANAYQQDIDACREAGMNDFLSKPVKLDTIKSALERAVEGIESVRKE